MTDGSLFHMFFECPCLNKLKFTLGSLVKKINKNFVLNNSSFLIGPPNLGDPNCKINYLLCLAKHIINMYHIKLVFNENNQIRYHTNVLNRIYLNELSKKLQNEIIYIYKEKQI
jgi:hypothetical protein